MKIKSVIIFLWVLVVTPIVAMADGGYKLVWSDEFNTGTTLGSDWTHEVKPSGYFNNELENYVDGQIDGKRVTEIKDGKLNVNCFKYNGKIYSGRVYADVKTGWQYGFMEARIKLPKGKGVWPAFWMMPVNRTDWPTCGELDIMENVGFDATGIHSTIHCKTYNNGGTSIEKGYKYVSTAESDYHLYAMKWTPTEVVFYVDGDVILTYKNDGNGFNTWPFDNPFYLILNVAWGGDWGGQQGVDESALPVTMSVDYVRVYQKTADGTLNVGYDDISTPPAPTPLKDAANVKALYSNDYTSVAKNWTVGEWNQGTTTVQKELAIGNLAYFNTNFNYLGFQYGGDNDVVDMSDMDYLHFDIYPTSNMTVNVYPITKKADGTADDTQKKAVALTANKWNQIDLSVADFKKMGLDMSKNFQLKFDGGDGTNIFVLDNIYFWKTGDMPAIAAAPTPTQSAANVKSLYSDAYTSVAPNWQTGAWWQSTRTFETELASGDKAYYNTKFNYLGFNYSYDGSDGKVVDMSDMDYMHLDIYPMSAMTVNIYPITKKADGSTNDSQKMTRTLAANRWNQIDLSVADFKSKGLDMSKNFQIKLDNGNGSDRFFLDNIYFWKSAPTGVTTIENAASTQTFNVYSIDGRLVKSNAATLDGLQRGLYIINDKKTVMK